MMILFIFSSPFFLLLLILLSSEALLLSLSPYPPRSLSSSHYYYSSALLLSRCRSARLLQQPSSSRQWRKTLLLGSSANNGESSSEEEIECGNGFYKQTGPDGDYCVLDYDAVLSDVKDGCNNNNNKKDEHYWDAFESQNKARRKFGLPNLTPEQYVALQAENHLTAQQQIVDATAQAFDEFDTNNGGVVCGKELKEGLQKILRKTDHLSERQAQKVMEHFDDNGDGVLQPDEFITVGELRNRLDAVIEYEKEEMASMTASEQQQQQHRLRQQREQQEQEEGGISLLGKFFNMFVDTCETNYDCDRPEVCCDLGYRKMCCSSGQNARQMQLEYAMVPVVQEYNII